MDFVIIKVVLLLNSRLLVSASPVAMVQHATSSQSFVIHEPQTSATTSNLVGGPSSIGNSIENQPKYEYKYEVSDHQTGDRKSHWETREGDKVRGVYTLYEPDGALRRVEYTADSIHGFNAVVSRNGQTQHFPPPQESSFNLGSSNRVSNGYDSSSQGYIPERAPTPSSGYGVERSRYSGPNIVDGGLGFSVTHGSRPKPSVIGVKPY